MSNMSYCRFENTVGDMDDCLNALIEDGFDARDLSPSEQCALEEMYNMIEHLQAALDNALEQLEEQQND